MKLSEPGMASVWYNCISLMPAPRVLINIYLVPWLSLDQTVERRRQEEKTHWDLNRKVFCKKRKFGIIVHFKCFAPVSMSKITFRPLSALWKMDCARIIICIDHTFKLLIYNIFSFFLFFVCKNVHGQGFPSICNPLAYSSLLSFLCPFSLRPHTVIKRYCSSLPTWKWLEPSWDYLASLNP